MKMARTIFALATSLMSASAIDFQQLFVSDYQAYPTCYRQPVLIVLDPLHMIVFIEGRNNTWCSGTSDGSPSSVRLKYTADGGNSWSSEAVLYTGGIDFLCSVYDNIKGRVHLFIQLGSKILYTTTDDGGATFTPVAPLTVGIPAGISYAQPSVAHGLVLDGRLCGDGKCAGEAGRLIIPFICHAAADARSALRKGDVACPGCYSCLMISDDRGATWKVGAVSNQDGTREASLIQLVSPPSASHAAVVYASERNMGARPGYKQHATSVDGGSSFAMFGNDTGIPDCVTSNWTGVVSGATRVGHLGATGPSGPQRLLISTPINSTERQDMGIFISNDETGSWETGVLLRAGPAGYSDIAAINDTHVAIVFENGDDDSEFDFAKRISIAVFDAFSL